METTTSIQRVEPRVLIVDDDDEIIHLIYSLVESLFPDNTTIRTADNIENAIKQYHELLPNVVLTDLLLPNISGHELIRHIRKHDPLTVIVVITNCYEEYLSTSLGQSKGKERPEGVNMVIDKIRLFKKLPEAVEVILGNLEALHSV